MAGKKEAAKHVKAVASGLANARTRLNDGHGDNVLAVLWALLGIQLSGDETAIRSMFDYNKAFINMARITRFTCEPMNALQPMRWLPPPHKPPAEAGLVPASCLYKT